jgi:hypothetical protein
MATGRANLSIATNADVADLYERVRVGAGVKVLSEGAVFADASTRKKWRTIFDWMR